jgi:hypothetical protein
LTRLCHGGTLTVDLAAPSAKKLQFFVDDFVGGFDTYTEKLGHTWQADVAFADVGRRTTWRWSGPNSTAGSRIGALAVVHSVVGVRWPVERVRRVVRRVGHCSVGRAAKTSSAARS